MNGKAKQFFENSSPYLIPLFLLAAGFLAYSNTFSAPFILDDKLSIVENLHVRSLASFFGKTFSQIPARHFLYFTFALNYALSGLNVWSYHFFNLAIHLLAALTLFAIVKHTLLLSIFNDREKLKAVRLAFWVSITWLLHPLQTASVTYVSQRAESLMGLMYFLTFYFAIRCFKSDAPLKWMILSVVSCFLGMETKQTIVTAPFVLFLYDRIFISKSFRELFQKRKFFYLGLLASVCRIPTELYRRPGPGTSAGFFLSKITWAQYAKSEPGVILHYLKLVFWPVSLCLDYVWPIAASAKAIVFPTLVIGALILLTIWSFKWRPEIGFLGAWFFLILSPTSSFVPLADLAFEHRMYLPLAGIIAAFVFGLKFISEKFFKRLSAPIFTGVLIGITAAAGYLTFHRNQDYKSALSIWSDTLAKRPDNPRAHNNLGAILSLKGNYEEAGKHFSEAVRLDPDYGDAYINLGYIFAQAGKLDDAALMYLKAVQTNPQIREANYNLGNAFMRQGKFEDATHYYKEELRINPYHFHSHNNLANLLLHDGNRTRTEEAILHYQTAIEINPEYLPARNNLGIALARLGKLDEAVAQYSAALKINPNAPDLLNSLGSALAEQGKLDEATRRFTEALRLRPNFPEAKQNLALIKVRQSGTQN